MDLITSIPPFPNILMNYTCPLHQFPSPGLSLGTPQQGFSSLHGCLSQVLITSLNSVCWCLSSVLTDPHWCSTIPAPMFIYFLSQCSPMQEYPVLPDQCSMSAISTQCSSLLGLSTIALCFSLLGISTTPFAPGISTKPSQPVPSRHSPRLGILSSHLTHPSGHLAPYWVPSSTLLC